MTTQTKTCQNCKQNFVIEPDDFVFYEKIQVPPPTFCPQCRLIRRLAWRNERTFHKNTCALCKKSIISIYAPENDLIVYCPSCWWSDKWDALEYGVEFDPQRPFMTQAKELFSRVPQMNLHIMYTTVVNSEYVTMAGWLKNCYLTTYSDKNEDCGYASLLLNSKDTYDILIGNQLEGCYECTNCQACYHTFFSVDCNNCNDVYFSKNCVGCNNCFGCVNLRNKSYHIFNKPHSKEEYEEFLKKNYPSTRAKIKDTREKARELWMRHPHRYYHGRRSVNFSGDYIAHSKNTHQTYVAYKLEDCKFCAFMTNARDCYDCTNFAEASEMMYEICQCGDQNSRILFSWWACTGCSNIEYSMFPIGCKNVFGCVGTKKKEYCILNKQYTKSEYEKLRAQIIEQMDKNPYKDAQGNMYKYGEFFPIELSPFGYNETTAHEFFPLDETETKSKGYNWRDLKRRTYESTKHLEEIPDASKDTDESVTKEVLECAHKEERSHGCTKGFRIIPQELQFYKKTNLPLPNLCPNCRYYERRKWQTPITLHHRKCECAGTSDNKNIYQNAVTHPHGNKPCPNSFETTYAPNRPEIIYCEECYQQEVA